MTFTTHKLADVSAPDTPQDAWAKARGRGADEAPDDDPVALLKGARPGWGIQWDKLDELVDEVSTPAVLKIVLDALTIAHKDRAPKASVRDTQRKMINRPKDRAKSTAPLKILGGGPLLRLEARQYDTAIAKFDKADQLVSIVYPIVSTAQEDGGSDEAPAEIFGMILRFTDLNVAI